MLPCLLAAFELSFVFFKQFACLGIVFDLVADMVFFHVRRDVDRLLLAVLPDGFSLTFSPCDRKETESFALI